MIVTTKGRIILWEQDVIERKYDDLDYRYLFNFCCSKICSPATIYKVYSSSKSYRIDAIRQISQFYSSSAACFLLKCCSSGYECGVEVK